MNRRSVCRLQRGVAAIEFAFVFMVLYLFMYGIVTFGAVLYTQQTIARAAEDGARAVLTLSSVVPSAIEGAVHESLASSLVFPTGSSASRPDRLQWLKLAPVTVTITGSTNVTVTVTYPYSANPLLPALPLASSWLPATLTGKAVVARPS